MNNLFEEDDNNLTCEIENPYLKSVKIMDNSEIIIIDSDKLKNSEGLLWHSAVFFEDLNQ